MKIRFFLHVVFLSICLTGWSQGKFTEPAYGAIKSAVSDPSFSSYYPKLMKRYLNHDVTLTADEFRLLYYGFLYQDKYEPYSLSMEHNVLSPYLEKETLDVKECDNILNEVNRLMINSPFNFHLLRMAVYALHMKGEHAEADKRLKMLNGVIDAILSSGDGKTMRTAFHVIYTQHEYEIVNILGYNAEYQTLNNNWDIINISKNSDKIPVLYFNIGEMLEVYRKRNENR